ncbi:phage major capsid protein [Haliea sp. E17]|uniref:phage major capsid protein n=1 Tax=Haliea sp. E17 TaxID=3401576 RepID=UPI003AB0D8D0
MNTETKLIAALSGIVDIQKCILYGVKPTMQTKAERLLETATLSEVVGGNSCFNLELGRREVKSAILSTGAINDPLVPSGTPTLDYGARRSLFLQDLLPTFPTNNGAIEIPVLSSKTNNAGPQVGNSPEQRENVEVGESAYAFTNSFVPVETIGHTLPVSKQIFEDSGQLDGFISTEMLYGLAEAIEDQLLNGAGTTGTLDGLLNNATAWANESPNITNEVDVIRSAIKQVRLANFAPNGVILNESDWYDIETRKQESASDAYVAGAPRLGGEPRIWGIPVYVSNVMASGSFLVADFNRCGIVFENQAALLEVSANHGTNFTRGMLQFMASSRLALVNTNPLAMVTGSL